MPAPALKSMATDAGISMPRAEKLWKKAKALAKEAGRSEKDGDRYWKYVMGVFKKSAKIEQEESTMLDVDNLIDSVAGGKDPTTVLQEALKASDITIKRPPGLKVVATNVNSIASYLSKVVRAEAKAIAMLQKGLSEVEKEIAQGETQLLYVNFGAVLGKIEDIPNLVSASEREQGYSVMDVLQLESGYDLEAALDKGDVKAARRAIKDVRKESQSALKSSDAINGVKDIATVEKLLRAGNLDKANGMLETFADWDDPVGWWGRDASDALEEM